MEYGQLTPVLLPGKFHGWWSLVGYSPWGCKELDMTEQLRFHLWAQQCLEGLFKCMLSFLSLASLQIAETDENMDIYHPSNILSILTISLKKTCFNLFFKFLAVLCPRCCTGFALVAESRCLVAQLCLTLCDPVDCIARQAPLSMWILQTRILEWVAMPSSRGSSQPRD